MPGDSASRTNQKDVANIVRVCLTVVFAIAALLVLIHQCKEHYPKLNEGGDWAVYYRAGAAMAHRQPIYTLERGPLLTFKNAPVVALFIAPLTILPPYVARFIWFFGDVALLACIVAICRRLMNLSGHEYMPMARVKQMLIPGWVALGAWFFTERFIMYQLGAGTNATLYITLSLVACYWMTAGRPLAAGAALSGAVFLKVVPICLLPYLLLHRGRTRAMGSFTAMSLVLAVLPAVWIGWNANRDLLVQWPRHLRDTNTDAQDARPSNQSAKALVARLFGPELPDRPGAPLGAIRRFRPHVYLSAETVNRIWMAISIAVAVALYGLIWVSRQTAGMTRAMHFSLLLIYMTLFNPLAWRYNFIALIVPAYFVIHTLRHCHAKQHTLLWMLAAAYALNSMPYEVRGMQWLDFFQVYGSRTLGTLILAAAVIIAWRSQQKLREDAV